MELDIRYNSTVSRKGTLLDNRLSDTTTSSRGGIEKFKSRISLVVDSNETIMGSKVITENMLTVDQKKKYRDNIIEIELHYQSSLKSNFRKAMQLIHYIGETPNCDSQSAVEELFRVSENLVEDLAESLLTEPKQHIRSYTRIFSIYRSNDYWKMSQELKDTVDTHYKQEQLHNESLEQFKEELRILHSYNVISKETCIFGIATITELLCLSNEKLQNIIYNPNTLGIMFRETDIIIVYEHFNQFTNNASFEISNYKVLSRPSWFYLGSKYKREQVAESIKRFENYINVCAERLIEYQHYLQRVKNLGGVDENQTKLALFTVTGVIRDFMIRSGYNLDIKLEPLRET
ncbi:hypothetical protein HDV06_002383 [Boothiomyces sp. JEL0866]|nr:hypothetical protein HDV06_002383 [Boothiomyces sp. JEL0866]